MNEKSVGGVVFRRERGRILYLILLYERQNDEGKRSYWDFPKGHMEEEENEEQTLRREIHEETSISDIRVIEGFRETIRYFFSRDGKPVSKEVVFYLCETAQEKAAVSWEHKDLKWLEYGDAMKALGFDNAKELLKKADRLLA